MLSNVLQDENSLILLPPSYAAFLIKLVQILRLTSWKHLKMFVNKKKNRLKTNRLFMVSSSGFNIVRFIAHA